MHHGTSMAGATNVELRQGGNKGQPLVSVTRKAFANTYTVTLLDSRWQSPLTRKGAFRNTHTFLSKDGTTLYKWKLREGWWTGDWAVRLFQVPVPSWS